VFQQLASLGRTRPLHAMLQAPFTLHKQMLAHIARVAEAAAAGQPARIVVKINALTDVPLIEALIAAARAGTEIDLVVRGACMLRPGVAGSTERIRVRSIVGRFLEHSRIYAFERDGEATVYIASADLMPRNLDHRVELGAPIEAPELRAELLDTLERAFADNQNSWELDADRVWTRRTPAPGEQPRSLHLELMELYAALAAEEPPTD
jgi:polyphosphate kinase